MKIYNRTGFDLDKIQQQPLLKIVDSTWRRRHIKLFEHFYYHDYIISVGVDFDGSQTVVCEEKKEDWTKELMSKSFYIITQ